MCLSLRNSYSSFNYIKLEEIILLCLKEFHLAWQQRGLSISGVLAIWWLVTSILEWCPPKHSRTYFFFVILLRIKAGSQLLSKNNIFFLYAQTYYLRRPRYSKPSLCISWGSLNKGFLHLWAAPGDSFSWPSISWHPGFYGRACCCSYSAHKTPTGWCWGCWSLAQGHHWSCLLETQVLNLPKASWRFEEARALNKPFQPLLPFQSFSSAHLLSSPFHLHLLLLLHSSTPPFSCSSSTSSSSSSSLLLFLKNSIQKSARKFRVQKVSHDGTAV